MTLQNPSALLWLLPLAGAIILLYLLKMRRREVRVPATFLWPNRVEEIRANSLFQRLRFSWLMVLQLLALAILVFCLARPQTKQEGLTGEATVIVIDSSASMGATDVKPSRFAEAKRLVQEAVQSAEAGDRIALIEAGPSPKVVFPLSNDPARQLAILKNLTGADSESDVGESLRLASSLVSGIDGARIVLLSDGVFEPVANFSRGSASLVYRRIGETDDNLSISALGTAETPSGRQLYCGVRNWCDKPMFGTLTIQADGKTIDSVRFDVKPKGQYGRSLQAPSGAKVFEARLDAPDILKSDNYAVTLAQPGSQLRVLLVSSGDMFLERALALDPRVTLDRSQAVPADGATNYDIVVFDGVPEQPVKARGVMTLGAAGSGSPVEALGGARGPEVRAVARHKLLEGVDFRSVFIDRVERVTLKPEGKVLVESSQGPMLVTSERATARHLYLSFSPLESDFPLQVGFPIFIANALDYLAGSGSSDLIAVRAGTPFAIPGLRSATLTDPDGVKADVVAHGEALVVREVRKVGKHVLEANGRKRPLYASLRSDRESQVGPAASLLVGGGEVKSTHTPVRFNDFWRPLIILCLLLLALEWWTFMRRS